MGLLLRSFAVLLRSYIHSFLHDIMTKFFLLEYTDKQGNSNILDHDELYLDIESFPDADRQGKGSYSWGSWKTGEGAARDFADRTFEFTPSRDSPAFDAWHAAANQKFVLTPIVGESGEITGLTMTYPHSPLYSARFCIKQPSRDSRKDSDLLRSRTLYANGAGPRHFSARFSKEETVLFDLRNRLSSRGSNEVQADSESVNS